MLAADITIKLDLPLGAVDFALIERLVHQSLGEHGIPVVDVEMDGLRVVDSPLGPENPLGPIDPGYPRTPPPGARF